MGWGSVTARQMADLMAKLGLEKVTPGQREVWSLCPFHVDRDGQPTRFHVRVGGERGGQYHCHSCHEGGGLVDLVFKVLGFGTHRAAKEWLEARGLRVAPPSTSVRLEAPPLFTRPFRAPPEVVTAPLDEWVTPARQYAEGRGLSSAQVERWGLGYALDGRLRGRIVVPIRDRARRWRSYMARTFVDSDRRYYYPRRDEERPDLDALFGEEHWPAPEDRRGRLVVVTEGGFKTLAVERAFPGVPCGALGGSEVRAMHVAKLSTFGGVVVFTDDDDAGRKARVALAAALGRHIPVRHAALPVGLDADSVTRQFLVRCLTPALRSGSEP
jgi:DNA primase